MNTYYNPDDLAKFPTIGEEAPALWDAFLAYYGPVMADGALTAREKALIALAIAHLKCAHTALIPILRRSFRWELMKRK